MAAPVLPASSVDTDAKLALLEFLLTSIDLQESARRSVEWLVAHAPVSEAVVLVIEPLSNEVLLVAEHGVPSGAIMEFALSRDDSKHPLIEALSSDAPVMVEKVGPYRVPLEGRPFYALPLRADAREPSQGLLIISGRNLSPDAETIWVGLANCNEVTAFW